MNNSKRGTVVVIILCMAGWILWLIALHFLGNEESVHVEDTKDGYKKVQLFGKEECKEVGINQRVIMYNCGKKTVVVLDWSKPIEEENGK